MKLGTRLVFTFVPTIAIVMLVYAGWALIEREHTMVPEARQEVQAYATALGLAFDLALEDVRRDQVQALVDEITQAPTVFGVLVYDSAGARTLASAPLGAAPPAPRDVLERVLETGGPETFERVIDGHRVYSVLRPLRDNRGQVSGALEVAQPLASLEAQKARVRRRYLLNTLTLVTALSLVTFWLVQRVVARPMSRLVGAARAIGAGELGHRIAEEPQGGELAVLAHEFNGMAERLEGARTAMAQEAEERVELERRLRHAEKMAAVGTLAAGLAHEIAAPLNVISGRAEMLLRRETDVATRERNLEIVVRQSRRIATIVRNLLDFAKRRDPRLELLEMGVVVETALEFLDGELQRSGVEVQRALGRAGPVRGDADFLHQVFVNLILNAIQAMEANEGRRVLMVRLEMQQDGTGSDGSVVIELADNGPGIPPGLEHEIFEPFVTTKPRGTGLGLVVARSIVEQHGGRLEASNGSDGARFRVVLPAIGQPAAPGVAVGAHA